MVSAQIIRFSHPLRRRFSRFWYDFISGLDKEANMLFMNFGYTDLDPTAKPLVLSPEDESNRYPVQFYHHVAKVIDWTGLRALEISSGRGGGANYIMKHFRPASMDGIDLSSNAINFCKRYYTMDGLSFHRGSAVNLQFPNNAFDVVINIEASQYYPSMLAFIKEVVRVLKPGGHFLYADIRYVEEIDRWRSQLAHPDLELLVEEDITPNVLKSLQLDTGRRQALIQGHVPRLLRRPFYHFAGTDGAGLARGVPKVGERLYLNFVFRRK